MNKTAKEFLYDSLHAQIRFHKYMYYKLSNSEITDQEYDRLEKQLDKVAEELKYEGSWVGCND